MSARQAGDRTGRYSWATAEQLDALPVGTVRDFDLHGVLVELRKEEGGSWELHERGGIPSRVLARSKSAPRDSTPRTPATASTVAAIGRVVAASRRE